MRGGRVAIAAVMLAGALAVAGPVWADMGDPNAQQEPVATMDAPEVVATPETAVVRLAPFHGVEAATKTRHHRKHHKHR